MLWSRGFVGSWRLENNALDGSGNGYNGTVSGATYTAGQFGQEGSFDGNDYISLPDVNLSLGDAFTIVAWVKTTESGASGQRSFVTRDESDSPVFRAWQLRYNLVDGTVNLLRFDASDNLVTNLSGTSAVNDGVGHFVAVTFDSAVGSKVYVAAKLENSDAVLTATHTGTGSPPLIAARRPSSLTDFLLGFIDEVHIWSRALTQPDIRRVMLGLHPIS